jgi:hypothetical protein
MRRGGKDHGGEVLHMVIKMKEMDGNGEKSPKAKRGNLWYVWVQTNNSYLLRSSGMKRKRENLLKLLT